MTNFPTDRRFLREIREPDIRPEIDPHIDYHIGTLTNDFVARRRRLFGFERDASEPIEVSLADPKHLDWDGPRNGADWGPCVRDGKRVIYRLFVGPSDWACPLCPETARQEPVLPLPKGKQLDAALDELAAALIRYQGEFRISISATSSRGRSSEMQRTPTYKGCGGISGLQRARRAGPVIIAPDSAISHRLPE
jgi:hypothetical protein